MSLETQSHLSIRNNSHSKYSFLYDAFSRTYNIKWEQRERKKIISQRDRLAAIKQEKEENLKGFVG